MKAESDQPTAGGSRVAASLMPHFNYFSNEGKLGPEAKRSSKIFISSYMGDTKKWLACDRCGSYAKEGKGMGDYCGQTLTADWKGIVCGGKIAQFELDRAFIQEGRSSFSREMVQLILLDYADYILKTAACDINTHLADYVLTELQAPAIKEWFERLFPPHILGGIS